MSTNVPQPSTAGHGVNPGFGSMKYYRIPEGNLAPDAVVFPSLIAPAGQRVIGALRTVEAVHVGETAWWVGDDALLDPNPRADRSQARLDDSTFIPALVRKAWDILGEGRSPRGYYVSCLPAAWASDFEMCKRLAGLLRYAGVHKDDRIRVVAEPLGLIYAHLLDAEGERTEDDLHELKVGVADFGHNTLDIIEVHREVPIEATMASYPLGTAGPLAAIRAKINATYDLSLSLWETDQAVRQSAVMVAGRGRPLPAGWDTPLIQTGAAAAAQLAEAWKSAAHLDVILVGGGGVECEPLVAATLERFPHARTVDDGQIAIAKGCAHLARRLARGL
jgi:hypothetical protein